MTEFEFKEVIAEYLSGWRFTDGELKVLQNRTCSLNKGHLVTACEDLLATHEHRGKPTVATILHIVQGQLGGYREPSSNEPDLPRAESYAAFHFYAVYLAADTPADKREAIKAYYLKRQELNAPLFGKEEEGIRDLLATCDVEIAVEATL